MLNYEAHVTKVLVMQGRSINQRNIEIATQSLKNGQIVVFPTETGYCFAGLAHRKSSHTKLWELRSAHPKTKPFSLLCLNAKSASEVARVSTPAFRLMNKLLPGPFTLILPVHRDTPNFSTGAHKNTIGIRISAHPIAQRILEAVDAVLVVTSVTDADELADEGYTNEDYNSQLDRWWTTPEGIEAHTNGEIGVVIGQQEPLPMRHSTIIELIEGDSPRVLRNGGWPLEGLSEP
jgi:tRNA threonylcarbamoyl adenosine modification protein (Sua5/YciO/YrdC/YwlC family)